MMLTTLYNGTFMTFLVTKICLVMLMVLTTPLSSYVEYYHYDLMMFCNRTDGFSFVSTSTLVPVEDTESINVFCFTGSENRLFLEKLLCTSGQC